MKAKSDRYKGRMWIDGEECQDSGDGVFEVLANRVRGGRLSELPRGIRIRLCQRVIGSHDLEPRQPYCDFEVTKTGELLAHVDTAFLSEDDLAEETPRAFFEEAVASARQSIQSLVADGTVDRLVDTVHDDIAYLSYSVHLRDQPILDAEAFIEGIEERLHGGTEPPMLFVCYASEDRVFVDRLVREMDVRALHAWYDQRELLVGDSIVERINEALARVRYVVAVLSPYSVSKPWATRELSSTLGRQLANEPVQILPVLAADCPIPPLLSDMKYADFRFSFDLGLDSLLAAIRSSRNGGRLP